MRNCALRSGRKGWHQCQQIAQQVDGPRQLGRRKPFTKLAKTYQPGTYCQAPENEQTNHDGMHYDTKGDEHSLDNEQANLYGMHYDTKGDAHSLDNEDQSVKQYGYQAGLYGQSASYDLTIQENQQCQEIVYQQHPVVIIPESGYGAYRRPGEAPSHSSSSDRRVGRWLQDSWRHSPPPELRGRQRTRSPRRRLPSPDPDPWPQDGPPAWWAEHAEDGPGHGPSPDSREHTPVVVPRPLQGQRQWRGADTDPPGRGADADPPVRGADADPPVRGPTDSLGPLQEPIPMWVRDERKQAHPESPLGTQRRTSP